MASKVGQVVAKAAQAPTARTDSWRRRVEVEGGRTAGMKSRPMQWADAADSLTERSCGSAAPSVIASVVRSARR